MSAASTGVPPVVYRTVAKESEPAPVASIPRLVQAMPTFFLLRNHERDGAEAYRLICREPSVRGAQELLRQSNRSVLREIFFMCYCDRPSGDTRRMIDNWLDQRAFHFGISTLSWEAQAADHTTSEIVGASRRVPEYFSADNCPAVEFVRSKHVPDHIAVLVKGNGKSRERMLVEELATHVPRRQDVDQLLWTGELEVVHEFLKAYVADDVDSKVRGGLRLWLTTPYKPQWWPLSREYTMLNALIIHDPESRKIIRGEWPANVDLLNEKATGRLLATR